MAVKDSNKQMNITISKEEYDLLEKLAKQNTRSVSKQALHFIKQGLEQYSEEQRDN